MTFQMNLTRKGSRTVDFFWRRVTVKEKGWKVVLMVTTLSLLDSTIPEEELSERPRGPLRRGDGVEEGRVPEGLRPDGGHQH